MRDYKPIFALAREKGYDLPDTVLEEKLVDAWPAMIIDKMLRELTMLQHWLREKADIDIEIMADGGSFHKCYRGSVIMYYGTSEEYRKELGCHGMKNKEGDGQDGYLEALKECVEEGLKLVPENFNEYFM